MAFINGKLKSNAGLGILEVLVAAAVMAVIIGAASSSLVMMQKSINFIDVKQELAGLQASIQIQMSDETSCRRAITGQNGLRPQYNQNLASTPSSSTNAGMPFQFKLLNGETLKTDANLSRYPFEIQNFELKDSQHLGGISGGGNRYLASVMGTVKSTKAVSGPGTFQRSFGNLFIDTDSRGRVTGCTSQDRQGGECKICVQTATGRSVPVPPSTTDCASATGRLLWTLGGTLETRPSGHLISGRCGSGQVSNDWRGNQFRTLCVGSTWVELEWCVNEGK